MFINAQKSNELDLGIVRNFNSKLNGVSGSFIHNYSEKWAAALDLSLFPKGLRTKSSITTKSSAVEISCKAYYKMPISKYWELFSIFGVGYTWDRETETIFGPSTEITVTKENYFSVLPGIGIKAKNSKFMPFAELLYSTGTKNQPMILFGLSHELK